MLDACQVPPNSKAIKLLMYYITYQNYDFVIYMIDCVFGQSLLIYIEMKVKPFCISGFILDNLLTNFIITLSNHAVPKY